MHDNPADFFLDVLHGDYTAIRQGLYNFSTKSSGSTCYCLIISVWVETFFWDGDRCSSSMSILGPTWAARSGAPHSAHTRTYFSIVSPIKLPAVFRYMRIFIVRDTVFEAAALSRGSLGMASFCLPWCRFCLSSPLPRCNRKWYNGLFNTCSCDDVASSSRTFPTASLSNVISLYCSAAVDKISTDIASRAVPLW